jgi:uncharacterized protein (TIGR02145 family)
MKPIALTVLVLSALVVFGSISAAELPAAGSSYSQTHKSGTGPHVESSTSAVGACCHGTRGNVDGTGIVDLVDLSSLVNYLVGGGYVLPCPDAANIDGSGIVDLVDLSSLVNYLVGGGYVLKACPASVTDVDGNMYYTVTIGSQVWMAENLRVTHYRNGDSIPNVSDASPWTNLITGAYCNYNNDGDNVATYGRLYNWYAVGDSRNIAPVGWHVASDSDWISMEKTLGMSQSEAEASGWRGGNEGCKLKETGTAHWLAPNDSATNESGFSALPGGSRKYDDGTFPQIGSSAGFWTSTEATGAIAWGRSLYYFYLNIGRSGSYKAYGHAVRCVKDN